MFFYPTVPPFIQDTNQNLEAPDSHVLSPQFGQKEFFNTPQVSNTLRHFHTHDSVLAGQVLGMAYDADYGIHDHTTDPHPWSGIILHPKEDIRKIDPFRLSLDKFLKNNVKELTGYTHREFTMLERSHQQMIIDALVHYKDYVARIQEEAKRKAEAEKEKLGKGSK